MPKSHAPYPPEFKRRLIEMVRAGRTPEEFIEMASAQMQAITIDPNRTQEEADRIQGLIKKFHAYCDDLLAERRAGGSRCRPSRGRADDRRARRTAPPAPREQTLREERDILKKAAAWFARETGSIPPKDSSS